MTGRLDDGSLAPPREARGGGGRGGRILVEKEGGVIDVAIRNDQERELLISTPTHLPVFSINLSPWRTTPLVLRFPRLVSFFSGYVWTCETVGDASTTLCRLGRRRQGTGDGDICGLLEGRQRCRGRPGAVFVCRLARDQREWVHEEVGSRDNPGSGTRRECDPLSGKKSLSRRSYTDAGRHS